MNRMMPKVGWWIIWSIAVFGTILWWLASGAPLANPSWSVILRAVGQLTGIIGLGWFAFTFVLNTRWGWVEESFGGLNKMYSAHHWLGGMSFILLLMHPITLALGRIYTSWPYAERLFVPTLDWRITLGQAAILVMQVVLIGTFFGRMLYQNWKFLHQWIGLAFFLGAIHSLAQGVALRGWSGLAIYELIALVVVVVAYSYRTLLHRWLVKKYAYRVVGFKKLNNQVIDIEMAPVEESIEYQAGQFVFVQFPQVTKEWHPFSLTSAEGNARIGVKALGDYTQKLSAKLQTGMQVNIERAYGRFFERNFPNYNMIWIAGGIGITPFVSMAKGLTREAGETQLIFSVAKENDLVYSDELNSVMEEHPNFHWMKWVSQTQGRIGIKDILKQADITKTEFYICGPTGMMVGLAKELAKAGASRKQIHTEMFAL